MKTHTQTSITVWLTFNEKQRIRGAAESRGKSMSAFLLHLGLAESNKECYMCHRPIGGTHLPICSRGYGVVKG